MSQVKEAKKLFFKALDADEKNQAAAFDLYLEAAEYAFKTAKLSSDEVSTQLKSFAKRAIERAEALKQESQLSLPEVPKSAPKNVPKPNSTPTISANSSKPNISRDRPSQKFTSQEVEVIRLNSRINGKIFVPFEVRDVTSSALGGNGKWIDPDGLPSLSEKQNKRLAGWNRAEDVVLEPTIINDLSPKNVTQTLVSDCSFVSAMILSAGFERKFKKQIITCSLFPQNKAGKPVLNPYGKYCVRLHLNGCWRRVLIDTRLPFDKYGKLLCSYSADLAELWVSLIEKAYLKVMGGYDFPGSNSSIDMHALTGWIPERKSLREIDSESIFGMLKSRMATGHVLATMATGDMDEQLESKSGLVPGHAYALLDLREANGLKFVKLKNPWSERRWKGKYGYQDTKSWTPELKKILGFDPEIAKQNDDGIFWIEWANMVQFYDTCYMSWDPTLFKFARSFHGSWKKGPKKDSYSMGGNPQYSLDVNAIQDSTIWIVLNRHITEKQDFANNKDFITLLVYETNGEKVFYPSEKKVLDGIRINSPFYLAKLNVPKSVDPKKYTLVVSEYEKTHDITFTLTVHSNLQFKLAPLDADLTFKKHIKGEWTSKTAGGCLNYKETYCNNPIHTIQVVNNSKMVFEIRAPKQYSVNLSIENESNEKVCESKSYRPGYAMVQSMLKPGKYFIRCSTFYPEKIGPFFLDLSSNNQFQLL